MKAVTVPATRAVRRQWSEEAVFYSPIEGLSLPGRRWWSRVSLSARGTQWSQLFRLRLLKDESQTLLEDAFSLNRGQVWTRSLAVNSLCQLQAQGFIQASGLSPAGALIELTGYYQEEPGLLFQSAALDLEAGPPTVIQDLFLPAAHAWEHAELTALHTGGAPALIRLGLLADGLLSGYPSPDFQAEGEAEGDQAVRLSLPVGANVPLIGIGRAESLVPLLTSHVQIILKGYYKKEGM